MTGMILRALPLAALVAGSGCATAGAGPARGTDWTPDERYVVVNNTSMDAVRVYALRHNVRITLGIVPGQTSGTFPVQGGMIRAGGRLSLMLVPTASGRTYIMDVKPLGQSRAAYAVFTP